jgi:hypothetical protein
MTVAETLPLAAERMVMILNGQRRIDDEQV